MALNVNQTVLISSKFLENSKKFQAFINRIEPDYITLEFKMPPLEIPVSTPLSVIFWDIQAVYSFDSMAITGKPAITTLFNIQKPKHIRRSFKRKFKRVDIKIKAEIKDIDNLNPEACFISDLSAGGAKTVAKGGKKPGTPLKISFHLPDGQTFSDIGLTIAHEKPLNNMVSEYGFEFTVISDIRRNKLNDFIMQYSLQNMTGQLEEDE